jgi:hypothetical protein
MMERSMQIQADIGQSLRLGDQTGRYRVPLAGVVSPWLNDADRALRTVTFDATTLDQLLTGFRRIPSLMEDLADQLEHRLSLTIIRGGRS